MTARERLHALWTERGWSVHTGTTGRHGGPPAQWSASWTDENGVCDVAFGPTEEEACAALLAKLEPADTLAALLDVLADLDDVALRGCYGLGPDENAPLDRAVYAWRRAGCPRIFSGGWRFDLPPIPKETP